MLAIGASRRVTVTSSISKSFLVDEPVGMGTTVSIPPWLLSGSGVMGSGLVVNRPREAESLGVGPDWAGDPLVALGAEESESHGRPDQVDEPARRSEML
jgi:hypothetical protein